MLADERQRVAVVQRLERLRSETRMFREELPLGHAEVRVGGEIAFAVSQRVVPGPESHAAVGRDDGTVSVYDLASRAELRRLAGHRGWVMAVAFSPDGRRLVSGGADTTALAWDVSALRPPE